MTLPPWAQISYEVLLFVGAFSCWGFLFRYATGFRWWRNDLGRDFVSMSFVIGAFYTYYAVVTTWPTLPGRTLIRTVLFVVLTVVLVWRWVMFERLRRKTKKGK